MATVDKGARRETTGLSRWTAPRVKRIDAGAAENGSGPLGDDKINHS